MFVSKLVRLAVYFASLAIVGVLAIAPASAATQTWDPNSGLPSDGSGTWNAGNANWWSGGASDVAWTNGNVAQFGYLSGNSNPYAVTVSGSFSASGLFFQDQAYTLSGSSGTLNLAGAAPTVTVNSVSGGTIALAITGTGGLTANGAGMLTLLGNNSYTGATNITSGTLQLGPGGAITNSSGVTASGPTSAEFLLSGGAFSTGSLPNGFITCASAAGSSGTIMVTGGALTFASSSGAGNFNIGNLGNATWTQTGGTTTFNSTGTSRDVNLANNGGSATVTLNGGSFLEPNTFGGMVVGQRGPGNLNIGGTAYVNMPVLYLGGVSGTSGSGTASLNGGTLAITAITKGGGTGTSTLYFNGGMLLSTAATTSFISGLTNANVLAGGALINTNGNSDTIPQNLLTGASPDGGLTQSGAGMLILTGQNTYNGPTTISSGTLQIGNGTTNGAIGSSSNIVDNAALVYNLASATAQSFSGAISGNGSLAMIGTGTLTISGTSTGFTGSASVAGGGTLFVNGPLAASGGVSIAGGATLSGSGSITSGTTTVASGGTLNFTQNTGGSNFAFAGLNFAGSATINLSDAGGQYASTPAFSAATLTTTSSPINLYVSNVPSSGTMQIVQYSSIAGSGTGAFHLASPVSTGRSIYALVPAGNGIDLTFSVNYPFWVGLGNNQWNTSSPNNWYLNSTSAPTTYITGDTVVFDDRPLNYSSNASQVVTIAPANVNPGSVTFSNTAVSYTVQGNFGITGSATTLAVNGAGTVTLSTSNNYGGGATLSGGLLNLGNSAALGSGPITLNGGSLDNTSNVPMTLPANNAQSWGGSGFTFVGSNPLNMGTGAVAISGSPTVYLNTSTLTVGGPISGAGR